MKLNGKLYNYCSAFVITRYIHPRMLYVVLSFVRRINWFLSLSAVMMVMDLDVMAYWWCDVWYGVSTQTGLVCPREGWMDDHWLTCLLIANKYSGSINQPNLPPPTTQVRSAVTQVWKAYLPLGDATTTLCCMVSSHYRRKLCLPLFLLIQV